jgi:hypothetical protein
MYQATNYFEQNAHFVSADVSEVDYQFATEPMTAVKLAEQQVNEEELLSSFEQAVSDRMEAISACSKRVSGPLTHQPHTTGDREGLVPARSFLSPRQSSSALPNVLVPHAGTRGAGIWSSLLNNPWQRGIILASLALLLLMSGFDLMGVLILHMR